MNKKNKNIQNELENNIKSDFITKLGTVPILFTVYHTIKQNLNDRSVKLSETSTKASTLYYNKHADTAYLIKVKDTGIDLNKDKKRFRGFNNLDKTKQLCEFLINFVNQYNLYTNR